MRRWFTTHWCLFQVREEDVGQPIAARAAQSRYHCDNSAKGELSIGAPMPFVDFGYSILEIKVRSLKPAALLCESPCPLRHMLQYLRVSTRFSAHEYSVHQGGPRQRSYRPLKRTARVVSMAVWPFTAVRQVPVRKNGQRLAGNMVALPPFIVPLLEAGLLLEAGKFSYAACLPRATKPYRIV
jgi:hypothetical protein